MNLNSTKKQLITDYIQSSKYPVSSCNLRRRYRISQRLINGYLHTHNNITHLSNPLQVGCLKQSLNLWTWKNIADKPRMKIQLINTTKMD